MWGTVAVAPTPVPRLVGLETLAVNGVLLVPTVPHLPRRKGTPDGLLGVVRPFRDGVGPDPSHRLPKGRVYLPVRETRFLGRL